MELEGRDIHRPASGNDLGRRRRHRPAGAACTPLRELAASPYVTGAIAQLRMIFLQGTVSVQNLTERARRTPGHLGHTPCSPALGSKPASKPHCLVWQHQGPEGLGSRGRPWTPTLGGRSHVLLLAGGLLKSHGERESAQGWNWKPLMPRAPACCRACPNSAAGGIRTLHCSLVRVSRIPLQPQEGGGSAKKRLHGGPASHTADAGTLGRAVGWVPAHIAIHHAAPPSAHNLACSQAGAP